MSKNIVVSLSEQEVSTLISSLLFSCSINVVSDTGEDFQKELLNLAKKIKEQKQDIVLDKIQFLKEESYEDSLSELVLEEFKGNIKNIVTFDQV